MNRNTHDTLTAAALRDLDPAPTTACTDAERERADVTLARILASPRHDDVAQETRRPRRRTRLLGAVGLGGAVAFAVPALLLGGGSAFASWTPTPEPLTGAAAAEAGATCLAVLGVPDYGEQVMVAERRGGWTYVLLTGPDSQGDCLMPEDLVGSEDPAGQKAEGFFGKYTADPVAAPRVPRAGIVEHESMQGSVPSGGLWGFGQDEEWVSWIDGYVGSGVTGVTVHTPVGTDVEASVANGRFAAWWPSDKPSSENTDVMRAWTYTVTLADGTTRQVAG